MKTNSKTKTVLLLFILIALNSIVVAAPKNRVGNAISWHKVEGTAIVYKVFFSDNYIYQNQLYRKYYTKTVKDTMIRFLPSSNYNSHWYEYRVQAIDTFGTNSELSDPVFFNKDTNFIINNFIHKNVYDTTFKIIYSHTYYDTIVKVDTVIKTKLNLKCNKKYDTVEFVYPIDTLTYTKNNSSIIDIDVEGLSVYKIEYYDLLGRRYNTLMEAKNNSKVFIVVVKDEKDDIILVEKVVR